MAQRFYGLAIGLFLLGSLSVNADNWTEFRGQAGDGHSPAKSLPLTWSETQNVRWKTPIHGRGWSTPVIWNKQVWLTTATEDGRKMSVLCIDKENGKILLDRELFQNADPESLGNDVNTYASPSPAIENGRVYVHFGSYGTACLDTRTFKTLWTRRDLPCRHYRGPSSSPVLFEKLLILTFDGADHQYVAALNKQTGKTVWKTNRSAEWKDLDDEGNVIAEGDMRKAHSTPLITTLAGRPEMISAGAKAAYGYDPRTGKELWKVTYRGFSASFRPVAGFGMAYLPTGYGRADLLAVKLGGSGDITDSHIAWKYSRNVPSKPSPLLIGDLLYLLEDSGIITCLDAKTGAEVWKERTDGHFAASPVFVAGRIYCFSEEGKTLVLKPGRMFQPIGTAQLKDGFMASPAIAGNAFFLRTRTHLYRIETDKPR
jgi:outer membrane protein assembly factor BamB